MTVALFTGSGIGAGEALARELGEFGLTGRTNRRTAFAASAHGGLTVAA